MRKTFERLAVVFVELASLAISQGWIGRAEMPHQAILIMGRQASISTPFHAGAQGAIDRLFGTFRHSTLLFGSTDLGMLFLSRDQKHTNLARISTQCRGGSYLMYVVRALGGSKLA